VGGGSTIDATKFIGAAACYDNDAWDFLGKWVPIEACLPIVTVLTLSATGSEMDAGGVISNLETKDKIGRMDPALLPKASFLDPTVTYTVNAYQTACGAADIMSHIIKVYFNMAQDLYMLDCMMEGLLKTVIKYTPIAIKEPNNYEARANLMWASSWAINGFVLGGKRQAWSCHPIEHEVSAIYDITHG
jgi:alcohol dehydrogenase YqhD (iron-dependent ADH family)